MNRELFTLAENQLIQLPEYLNNNQKRFEEYLDAVWKTRTLIDDESPDKQVSKQQQFLKFELSGGRSFIRAHKYVGFIQFDHVLIQIVPKLFDADQKDKAFKHLLWWLSYCKRVRFPFADVLSEMEYVDEFPEALIRYFAQFTHRLVSSTPFHQYEEVTETIPFMRGRLNTQQYINTSLSRGNWHQLVCDYQPFVFNNRLNQIIKYVARSLSHVCRSKATRIALEKLIFILDEVDDVPATAGDCDTLHLNKYFHEYDICVGMCRFFLAHSYLSQPQNHQRNFCFLLPMDYVFEKFILGISQTHLEKPGQMSIAPQNTCLTEEGVFRVKSDMVLTYPDKSRLVADTKYKVRTDQLLDKKAGINQADLYQMVSYALRLETRDMLLLYPLKYGQEQTAVETFHVNSPLLNNIPICIRALDLPVTGELNSDNESKQKLESRLLSHLTQAFKLTTT